MNDEILDKEFTEKSKKEKFKIINHLILIILWLAVILNLPNILDPEFKYLLAFCFLITSTVLLFVKPKIEFYVTLIMLLLGAVNILNHMSFSVTITFGEGTSGNIYSIDIFYIIFVLMHIGSNKEFYSKFFDKKRVKIEELPIENNHFMKKFESKTIDELNYINEASQFSKEAKTAAKELIKRKGKKEN
jgi:hypothetical protein